MSSKTMQIKQLREATYASFLDCAKALEEHNGVFDDALEHLRTLNLKAAEKKAERHAVEGLIVVKQQGGSACMVELNCETDFVAFTAEFKTLIHHIADRVLADVSCTDAASLLAAPSIDAPDHSMALSIKVLSGKLGENIKLGRVARYEAKPHSLVTGYIHAGAIDGYGPMEGRYGVLLELATDDLAAVDAAGLNGLAHNLTLQIASGSPVYVAERDVPAAVLAEKRAEFAAEIAATEKPDAIKARIVEGRLNKYLQEACLLHQAYIKDDALTVEAMIRQQGRALGTEVRVARFERFELGV